MDYILDNKINVHKRTGNYVCGWFGKPQNASPMWFIMNRDGKVLNTGRRNYIVSLFNRRHDFRTVTYARQWQRDQGISPRDFGFLEMS